MSCHPLLQGIFLTQEHKPREVVVVLNVYSEEGCPLSRPFSFSPPSAACIPTMCTLGLPDNPFTDEEAVAQRGTVLFPGPHSTRANGSSGHPVSPWAPLPLLLPNFLLFPLLHFPRPLSSSSLSLLSSCSLSGSLLTPPALPVMVIITHKQQQVRVKTLSCTLWLFLNPGS